MKIAIFAFVLLTTSGWSMVEYAQASTTFETEHAVSSVLVDFPVTGTGINRTPNYVFMYEIPIGVSFDTIQISVPESSTYNTPIYLGRSTLVSVTAPWDCINNDCSADDGQFPFEFSGNGFYPEVGTLEYSISSVFTATSSDHYLRFQLDSSGPDFYYNGLLIDKAVAVNGAYFSISHLVPEIRLCNGDCDIDIFTSIPQLTASPWTRLTFPIDGQTVPYSTSFQIESNTGTTTPTHVEVTFDSNYQTIVPRTFSINATGLSSEIINMAFPEIDDTVVVQSFLYDNATLLAQSTPINVNLRSSSGAVGDIADLDTCDQYNLFMGGICSVLVFLTVPSDDSLNRFTDSWESIRTKPPFGYVTSMLDELNSFDDIASSTPAFNFGEVPFVNDIFTPFRALLIIGLWVIYAMYFTGRLTRMDI